MKRATFWVPLTAVCFGVLWFAATMRPWRDRQGAMQLSKFAALPVLDGGRIKPIDTYARIQLMVMSRRQTYYDNKDVRQPAIKALLNVLAEGYATTIPTLPFVIHSPEVRHWFGLPDQPGDRYSLRDLAVNEKAMEKLRELDKKRATPEKLTPVERQVMALMEDLKSRKAESDSILETREKKGMMSYDAKIYRIENDQVRAMLGLEAREGFRYSLAEILGRDDKNSQRGERFKEFRAKAMQAHNRTEKEHDLVDNKVLELDRHLRTQARLRSLDGLLMVPPASGGLEDWKTLSEALEEQDTANYPALVSLERILRAYGEDNVPAFNKEVENYTRTLNKEMPAAMRKARIELWFNHFAPFYQCSILYVFVLLLAVLSWAFAREPLRRAAFWLAVVVCIVHTLALAIRIYLTGRPPVTNLYSSAVFIGWGCVLLCLFVEFVNRNNPFSNSIAVTIAALLGFLTMIVAHHLGGSGDTMEVMQAVLDTNFWLATHVTTVTLGYTATFVSGFLATVFIFRMLAGVVRMGLLNRAPLVGKEAYRFALAVLGLTIIPAGLVIALLGGLWVLLNDGEPLTFATLCLLSAPVVTCALVVAAWVNIHRLSPEFLTRQPTTESKILAFAEALALTPEASKALTGMVYGVVCFATLLSFVGTVLGGIWADQSWGRFWGWDPKENGALLIVVMNALILHARWGGMVKERGICVLAILGNMVTAWSWFGTNQLGVGLHAYGFNNTLALGCAVFWLSQLGLVYLGLMPLQYWRTFAEVPLVSRTTAPAGPRL